MKYSQSRLTAFKEIPIKSFFVGVLLERFFSWPFEEEIHFLNWIGSNKTFFKSNFGSKYTWPKEQNKFSTTFLFFKSNQSFVKLFPFQGIFSYPAITIGARHYWRSSKISIDLILFKFCTAINWVKYLNNIFKPLEYWKV